MKKRGDTARNTVRQPTRQNLLTAACLLFAQKGFDGTSIRDVCESAHANLAAVNYHFHGKDRLYVAAWRHALCRLLAAHPPDGGVPPGAPVEERLRGRVRALTELAADSDSNDLELVLQGFTPSGRAPDSVATEMFEPVRDGLRAVLREALGAGATSHAVEFCLMSVEAQCLGLMLLRRLGGCDSRVGDALSPRNKLRQLARCACSFCEAGIQAMRRGTGAESPV